MNDQIYEYQKLFSAALCAADCHDLGEAKRCLFEALESVTKLDWRDRALREQVGKQFWYNADQAQSELFGEFVYHLLNSVGLDVDSPLAILANYGESKLGEDFRAKVPSVELAVQLVCSHSGGGGHLRYACLGWLELIARQLWKTGDEAESNRLYQMVLDGYRQMFSTSQQSFDATIRYHILHRDAGTTHYHFASVFDKTSEDIAIINQFLAERPHFRILEARQWRSLSKEDAAQLLTNFLHKDLAFNDEVLPLSSAEAVAEAFFRSFRQTPRCYTNGNWNARLGTADGATKSFGWSPLTASTFDSGIIALDSNRVAMLWIEDED